MEKLKARLDAFSDAIIAIIITIMVLNISPVLRDSWPHYLSLGKDIGIYLISFIFVANMWYQHGTAFSEIDTMTYRILILDVFFLAALSLMPLFTNMMAENTTTVTVIMYGLLQMLVGFLFRVLAKAIVHLQYTDKKEMQKVYVKIYGDQNLFLNLLVIAGLVIAFFVPVVSLVIYLSYPTIMFLLNSSARQQMYDIERLPEEQQKDYVNLDSAGRRAFNRRNWDNDKAAAKATSAPAPSLQQNSHATSQPHSARKTDQSAGTPESPWGKPTEASRESWLNWLDQDIDPQRREQLMKKYDAATARYNAAMSDPDQRRAAMQRWLKSRRAQENRARKGDRDTQNKRQNPRQ